MKPKRKPSPSQSSAARAARGRPQVLISMSARALRGLDALAKELEESRGDALEWALEEVGEESGSDAAALVHEAMKEEP